LAGGAVRHRQSGEAPAVAAFADEVDAPSEEHPDEEAAADDGCRGKTKGRALLLEGFAVRSLGDLTVRADTEVPADLVSWVRDEVENPNARFQAVFGATPLPLEVFVYRDVAELHRFSCVSPTADGYYDGAIHVSAVPRAGGIRSAIDHELVHHALRTRGVRAPFWLHEGLAMYVSGERWWREPKLGLVAAARREHVPFAAMTWPAPDTASDARTYFQSLAMVAAVMGPGEDGQGLARIRAVVDDLSSRRVTPEDAFAAGLGTSRDDEIERSWQAAIARLGASRHRPAMRSHSASSEIL
jgi:hypothetical protein